MMGIFGFAGHLMLIEAHRLAPASMLAPFIYTQIIWMILLGFIVFGDRPDLWTLIGAAIVIASGLYVFARSAPAASRGPHLPLRIDPCLSLCRARVEAVECHPA